MAIKKRIVPVKVRPKPKSPHVRQCEDLYNRLQHRSDKGVLSAFNEILALQDYDHEGVWNYQQITSHVIEGTLERFDAKVTTYQLNYPDNVCWHVELKFTDRSEDAKYGFLYPSWTGFAYSTTLSIAVSLAYINLCKQAGRFL